MYMSTLRTRISHRIGSNPRYTLELEKMLVTEHAKLMRVRQLMICAKYLTIDKCSCELKSALGCQG
jgi:hypothetical protein